MADLVEKVEQEVAEIDKHQAFLEQSEGLVKKAILAIENVGKVANSKKFDYSEEEVEKMFSAMEEALADTKHMFKKKKEFHW
jgi:DNA helicase IV